MVGQIGQTKLADYDYKLPEELIALKPDETRHNSRLMCVDRQSGQITDKHFYQVIDSLRDGDLLIFNDTKVFPARLKGVRQSGGRCEVLLSREISCGLWEAMAKNVKMGDLLTFDQSILSGEVVEKSDKIIHIKFNLLDDEFWHEIERAGLTPLPPYINKKVDISQETYHRQHYQTVYAKNRGSIAAPTAGLHFSHELIRSIKSKGVQVDSLTLHVGFGTFLPVECDDLSQHKMHTEHFSIARQLIEKIEMTKKNHKRVIAVGTTTCRVLETVFSKKSYHLFTQEGVISGQTDIFILPPYKFKCVDALITNFHLPKSTLLMLVSAFSSLRIVQKAYRHAVDKGYRFYSYGDAMILE